MRKLALSLLAMAAFAVQAQNVNTSKFRQLGQELPTPNVYRTASGAPGHEYYQQFIWTIVCVRYGFFTVNTLGFVV